MIKSYPKVFIALIFIASFFNVQAQVITTYAGTGTAGYTGNGASALAANINTPFGLAKDVNDNLFIADGYNGCIRKVTPAGVITTVAGTGTNGYSGDGGAATAAMLNYPGAVATDAAGNIYISDYANNRIRKVTVSTGIISTVAGNGTNSFSGDGGLATAASISVPFGIAIDASNNIYFADQGNYRIRKVTASTGNISTIIGNGTNSYSGDGGVASAATIKDVHAVALDASGNIYFGMDNRIRKINASNNIVNTIVGNGIAGFSGDGAAASAATINSVREICFDNTGIMYFSDFSNQRIRKVTTANIISTIAGTGTASSTGDGGLPANATLSYPYGVVASSPSLNKIYIAEQGAHKIRAITSGTPASALNFDGINDYVVVPKLDFSAGNVMTIEAWIKPSNISTNRYYEISRQQIAAVNPPDWLLSFQEFGTVLSFGTRTTSGYNELDVTISAANYVDGNWHHIAAVYDGATKNIYRDGVLIGSNSFTGNLIYSPTAVNLIGNSAEVYNEHFNGSMDEVRMWNRALPQCEILHNMNCELQTGQTNLMAYYKFNQGFENQNNVGVTALADSSGNNRTGTLTNFGLTGVTSNWILTGGVTTGTTCASFMPLAATTSQTNVTPCFGGNNGSATVTASGSIGGYTYSWSPSGGTGATATGLGCRSLYLYYYIWWLCYNKKFHHYATCRSNNFSRYRWWGCG